METKFEREKRYAKERAMRQANIKDITEQLNEARAIYEVCNNYAERMVINRQIDSLEHQLYNEQTALATVGASEVSMDEVVSNMAF